MEKASAGLLPPATEELRPVTAPHSGFSHGSRSVPPPPRWRLSNAGVAETGAVCVGSLRFARASCATAVAVPLDRAHASYRAGAFRVRVLDRAWSVGGATERSGALVALGTEQVPK